jgi:SWI/SNF-related matrix-associated actin-dependent regulator 1 of chromatin subfamily A
VSGFRVFQLDGSPLWAISASYYSPKLQQAARSVPGMRWDGSLRAQVGYPDAVEQVVARLRELGLRTESAPPNERKWPHNLLVSYESARQYQRTGIDFLINQASSGALLADDMGCGKSFQAIKAARALRRKTVIVCPAHVRGVWERPAGFGDKGGELVKWWPKARVATPYGLRGDSIAPEADVVVVHYDIVHAWVEAILEWASDDKAPPSYDNDDEPLAYDGPRDLTVIFDEGHVLLNAGSRRSKACKELAHAARGRIALTGTPPTERVRDLHNLVETICPGRFGDFFPFARRYCAAKRVDVPGPGGVVRTVWDFSGKSNLKELRQRLDWFCLRRTKREVLTELPALQRQVVDVHVPARNRTSMNARIVGDKRRMRAALDNAANGKLRSVLDLVRSHLGAGQRVVVGTYRRAVCQRIADALSETAPTKFVHGGIPIPRRSKIIDELRRTEGPCCLVANIDCASTGIDLTFASVVVMAELVWEPRDLAQFEARSHRFGQEATVLVQYVIARGTGDELILQAVISKLDNFLDLVETDEGDGLKETLAGEKDDGLSRLAAALKKMGEKTT